MRPRRFLPPFLAAAVAGAVVIALTAMPAVTPAPPLTDAIQWISPLSFLADFCLTRVFGGFDELPQADTSPAITTPDTRSLQTR